MPAPVTVGFCCVDVKAFGPVQRNVTPVAVVVAVSCADPPAQTGPLFDALTVKAGQEIVSEAVPVIDAVTAPSARR